MSDTNTKPPVLFIHGLWIHAAAWQPWVRMFEEAGHDASAPGWPGDSETVEATRANPEPMDGIGIEDIFDVVFIDAEKEDYERYFELGRPKIEPGGLVVADNVLSHEETLGAYSRARQADPGLESVTVPLDRGLELSVVLTQSLK